MEGDGRRLGVTAYRDGRLTWRVPDERRDTAASALLARALAEGGEAGAFIWPSNSALASVDSFRFSFVLSAPTVDSAGRPRPLVASRSAVALFSMMTPWEEPVRPLSIERPQYPERALVRRYRGSTVVQFIVDTAGRPEPETVRDLWAASRSRLSFEERETYDSFVAAARRSAVRSRYRPARVGGCRVRQLVQVPYTFDLR